MALGSKLKMVVLAATASVLVGNVSFAGHPQGCNSPLPIVGSQAGLPVDCPNPPEDDPQQKLSACAYGAYAKVTQPLTSATATLNNVAPTNFTTAAGAPAWPALSAPCPVTIGALGGGYFGSNFVASASVPLGVSPAGVSTGIITTQSQAQPFVGGLSGYSLSEAETVGLSVAIPLLSLAIKADVVRSVAYCTKGAGPLGRNDDGPPGYNPSTLVNLTITHPLLPGGQITVAQRPGEDTWIPIPGVGGIMLRETWDLETPPYPGNQYKSFTENMIHLYLSNAVLAGDLVISQAHCDGLSLSGQPQLQH